MSVKSGNVIYSCPFVPAEWIEAHGLTPSRVAPSASDASAGPGVCPYARAFANLATATDCAAVVVTTACDQMRRAADIISRSCGKPVFLMNVPHTWQTPAARKLYIDELERLGRFLVTLGGVAPSWDRLRETMLRHDLARWAARQNPPLALSSEGSERIEGRVPIALIGGPVPRFDTAADPGLLSASGEGGFQGNEDSIFDLITRAGGYVALDGTETGERTMPAPFDRARIAASSTLSPSKGRGMLLETLADSYFAIPDPFRRPNSEFYAWLKRSLAERGIRALVLRRYVWCDTWHAEAERIREFAGLPFLHLDVGDGADSARTLSRLQSLVETLA